MILPVLPSDNPSQLKLNWTIHEEIGETVICSSLLPEEKQIWNGYFYEEPRGLLLRPDFVRLVTEGKAKLPLRKKPKIWKID